MPDREFIYVDGESHFIRTERAWCSLYGKEASLTGLRFRGEEDNRSVLLLPRAKVFWTRRMNPGVRRAIYFTSAVGDAKTQYEYMVSLREFELEPCIFTETRDLASQRDNLLNSNNVIEKAKQVDIALAVRMLHDAHRQSFDVCHLYTSNVDFVPLIEAVQGYGLQVRVHGYRGGLSRQSPLLHVPDQFIDLEESLRDHCEYIPCDSQSGSRGRQST